MQKELYRERTLQRITILFIRALATEMERGRSRTRNMVLSIESQ